MTNKISLANLVKRIFFLILISATFVSASKAVIDLQTSREDALINILRGTVRIQYVVKYQDIFNTDVEDVVSGSGILIANDRVLTCAHIAADIQQGVFVVYCFSGNTTLRQEGATVERANIKTDLMVLKLKDPFPVIPLKLASINPSLGDEIYFMGHTILPVTRLRITRYLAHLLYGIMLHPVYKGDSGGGVYNQQGELIGVINMVLSIRDQGLTSSTYIGYAIPLQLIQEFLQQPI